MNDDIVLRVPRETAPMVWSALVVAVERQRTIRGVGHATASELRKAMLLEQVLEALEAEFPKGAGRSRHTTEASVERPPTKGEQTHGR